MRVQVRGLVAAVVVVASIGVLGDVPAEAEQCVSVDGTGVCSTTDSPLGGGSVGGPTTVTTPAVIAPVEICYFLGCIPAGQPIVGSQSVVVPLPGPVPVPSVNVPGGWVLRYKEPNFYIPPLWIFPPNPFGLPVLPRGFTLFPEGWGYGSRTVECTPSDLVNSPPRIEQHPYYSGWYDVFLCNQNMGTFWQM